MSTVDGHVERKRAWSPVGAFPRARRDSRASGRPQVKIDLSNWKAGTAFFECMRLCCSEDHGAVRLRSCSPISHFDETPFPPFLVRPKTN
jgi:hypothetical protein